MSFEPGSLELRGFLSAEITGFIEGFRKNHSKSFSESDHVSDLATQTITKSDLNSATLSELAAIAFWGRCVVSCQAAILLCERGMARDAQTTLRSALESLIYGVALLREEKVLLRMEAQVCKEKLKQIDAIKKVPNRKEIFTDEHLDALEGFKADMPTGERGISVFEAAQLADMEMFYSIMYRGLSLISSHATLTSIESLLHPKAGGFDLVIGPTSNNVEFTLSLVVVCLKKGIAEFGFLSAEFDRS